MKKFSLILYVINLTWPRGMQATHDFLARRPNRLGHCHEIFLFSCMVSLQWRSFWEEVAEGFDTCEGTCMSQKWEKKKVENPNLMMGALNFQEKFIITSKACLICSIIRVTKYCSMKMILEQELDLGIFWKEWCMFKFWIVFEILLRECVRKIEFFFQNLK